MAKRRSSSNGGLNAIMRTIPSECKFAITMAANSTTEVWLDIDTNLQDGEAWLIYGAMWKFENIDPTVPVNWATELNTFALQVHRNDDHELLINANDDDLMFEDQLQMSHTVTLGGTDTALLAWPRRFGNRTVTLSPTLRAVFRTSADQTIISDASVQIAGKILYDRIAVPSIGQTKIGQIANL